MRTTGCNSNEGRLCPKQGFESLRSMRVITMTVIQNKRVCITSALHDSAACPYSSGASMVASGSYLSDMEFAQWRTLAEVRPARPIRSSPAGASETHVRLW
jgi:hypothetical protein